MNDVFLTLPLEKQQRIINAALQIFAKYEYKKASTDDIASIAGISKGSLFYYFKNKKSLYMYIFEYVSKMVEDTILDTSFSNITDFFEIMDYGAKKKIQIMNQNPYILDFVIHCISEKEFDISSTIISDSLNEQIEQLSTSYFKNIDFSKFKDSINPHDVYTILAYAMEGYILNKQRSQEEISIESLMKEFEKWKIMFKHFCYKEEYINE